MLPIKDLVRALGIIKASNLNPALYVVIDDTDTHIVVKNRITGTVKVLDKK